MNYEALRREICEIGALVHQKGYVAANDGNISVRLQGEDGILITPTGVSKGMMAPEQMLVVGMGGAVAGGDVAAGDGRPSSETKMHLAIYKANPDIRAVVHVHPIYATYISTWGEMAKLPRLCADIEVQVGEIPIAPYCPLGSQELADTAAAYCRDYNAVLLANHGLATWGATLREAYYRAEAVEAYCHIVYLYHQCGRKGNELSPQQLEELAALRLGKRQG